MCQCTYETSSALPLSASSGLPCPLSPPALHTLFVRTPPQKRWKFFREMRNIPHTDARVGASPGNTHLYSAQIVCNPRLFDCGRNKPFLTHFRSERTVVCKQICG